MCRRQLLIGASLLFVTQSYAQKPGASLRGQVVDALTGKALPGASVVLLPSDPIIGTSTDSLGIFHLEPLPIGLYTVEIGFVGYQVMRLTEQWLRAGKELVLRVELSPTALPLPAVQVTAPVRREASTLGARMISVEQSLRYPAMFFDPARVAGTTAGVMSASDQANHMIVRGNSPNANTWLLEGAEVVNPNHLTNAGTATDLPTLSGGGVNILSAQMLGPSRMLVGALPTDRGNTLGGLMDMTLRPGNDEEQEWTVQAGLIGLDVCTEGPFRKGKQASYLVNYRYSTLGLLSAIGVDLGDEAISFQDLAVHLRLPFGSGGEVRFFGTGGTSQNVFEAERDTALWEFDKDGSDITYRANTGAIGSTARLPIGGSGSLRFTVLLSATEQGRDEVRYGTDLLPMDTLNARVAEQKLSAVTSYDGAIGGRFRFTVGGSVMERRFSSVFDEAVVGWLLRPYANGRWYMTEALDFSLGMALAHFTGIGSQALEPRSTIRWRIPGAGTLALAGGMRSMLPWYQVMGQPVIPGIPLVERGELLRSQDIVLGYDHTWNDRLSFHVECYQQRLTGLPTTKNATGSDVPVGLESTVNYWDEVAFDGLANPGTATNQGLEVTVDHSFANSLFYQVNASIYSSRYELEGSWSDTRWNGNYLGNVLGGAEFKKEKEERLLTWGVTARVSYAGGLRYTPFDVSITGSGYTTNYGEPYSAQLNDMLRCDLRVYRKCDRNGRTGMWAIDLQNVANARNEAFVYFDRRKGAPVTKYQLGIIPNISYRIEF